MRFRSRLALFLVIAASVITWVYLSNGEHAALPRHFLRNLMRHIL